MSKRVEELRSEYLALAHAMQSGVAFFVNAKELEPKHLRVGVNSAMVEHGALVSLLLKKGLFTEEEYMESLVDFMRKEVEEYRQKIAKEYGMPPESINLA